MHNFYTATAYTAFIHEVTFHKIAYTRLGWGHFCLKKVKICHKKVRLNKIWDRCLLDYKKREPSVFKL